MKMMESRSTLPPALRFTSLLLLIFTQTSAAGEFQVTGWTLPIVAAPGDDVILPCRVEPQLDVADLTVEWSKPDLGADPNRRLRPGEYVHLYRDNREVPDMKMPSYVSRASLFTDGLKRGNVSLRVTNVTHEDEGRYRCFIPKLKGQIRSSVVQLTVEGNVNKTASTETPLHHTKLLTPEPSEEKTLEGGLSQQSILIPAAVFCVVAFSVGVGVYLYFVSRHKKTPRLKETLI